MAPYLSKLVVPSKDVLTTVPKTQLLHSSQDESAIMSDCTSAFQYVIAHAIMYTNSLSSFCFLEMNDVPKIRVQIEYLSVPFKHLAFFCTYHLIHLCMFRP